MPAGIHPNCSSTSFAFATTVAQVERMSAGDSYVRRLAQWHISSEKCRHLGMATKGRKNRMDTWWAAVLWERCPPFAKARPWFRLSSVGAHGAGTQSWRIWITLFYAAAQENSWLGYRLGHLSGVHPPGTGGISPMNSWGLDPSTSGGARLISSG